MRPETKPLAPLMLTTRQVAVLLGISLSSFYEKRRQLIGQGFPQKHPVLQRYHREAVECWLAEACGLSELESEESFEI